MNTMFGIIYFIPIIIVFFVMLLTTKSTYSLTSMIKDVFTNQEFSNISTVHSTNSTIFIRADSKGQNYLFAVQKSNYQVTLPTLRTLYDLGEQLHIHAKIVVTYTPPQSGTVIHKQIKDYSLSVWDYKKLYALAYEQEGALINEDIKYSVLDTIDTSDDKCNIDTSSNDPIKEQKGFLDNIISNLFNGPTHL